MRGDVFLNTTRPEVGNRFAVDGELWKNEKQKKKKNVTT